MGINFSSFEIGRRALNANQLGIEITGHNIANVNTPGYSRRSVYLAESPPDGYGNFQIGTGVTVESVQAFRDNFIESRIQRELGIAGYLSARRDSLFPVESALQGVDGGGIQASISDFFGAFRDLEANPDSVPLRSVVTGRAQTVTDTFHSTAERLQEIRSSTDLQIRATVDEVNRLSERIATLNVEIRKSLNAGGDAEALRDQRNELLNGLSELTGARSTQNDDGTITITVGEGRALVNADQVHLITADNVPPFGLAELNLDGQPVVFESGTINGLSSAIDTVNDTLETLDGIAAEFAARVNAIHTTGTDLDGNPGVNIFDTSGTITASTIRVDPTVRTNPRLIVASALPQPSEYGTVAGQIAGLLTETGITVGSRNGSFSSIYGTLITDAGSQVRDALDGLETQAAIIAQATAQRESISGVSLDEEAISLLQYQKAFEAAAKFIRVADEMTQTIISLGG
ncbi:MAG: flagellar hook-associated protein FlgK [Pyrinomonadaceae bacterium]